MSNIGSEFDARIGASESAGYKLLAEYALGDVIPYERIEDELDDPAWHVIRDYLREVPGEGWRYVGERNDYSYLDDIIGD